MADHFANLVPWRADGLRVLEAKILLVLTGGGSSGVTAVGTVAVGTSSTPNSLGLAATVVEYNQFDGSGNYLATFYRNQNGVFV